MKLNWQKLEKVTGLYFGMTFYSDECVLFQFISLTRTFLVSHVRVK